ncbi:MAG: MlaD family protein [Flavisolibacter sp.]|jgi:phospholipid/cholesterol/gamma-HCH transport system substrate-binding protein
MKLSNETKVGILAIAAIVILVLGFNFLKGNNIFSNPPVFYAKFTEIGSLEKSNLVKINGLPVGTVYAVKQADKRVDFIIVEIHLNRDILIPDNSIAFIDASILGSAIINVEKGNSETFYKNGDTISTRLDKGIIGNIQTQLMPTMTRVNETLDSMKIAIGGISGIFDPRTKNNLQDIIANIAVSTMHLQQLLNAQHGQLAQALANLNNVTGNLAKNNDAINSSIRNVEVTTSKLANANIEGTFAALQSAVSELKTTIGNLNSKNGSLGLLMNDRELYDRLNKVADRLNKTALSAEITIDDLRMHPKRYVNLSLFGGKNKGQPLSSPAVKDTVPK